MAIFRAGQMIASSIRDYVDNRWLAAELSLTDALTVSTAAAVFAPADQPRMTGLTG